MEIYQNFVQNIFFAKKVKYFWIFLQKTWTAGQVILKFGVLSNQVMLRKKVENKNFTWAAVLSANIFQIFSSPFSSENIWCCFEASVELVPTILFTSCLQTAWTAIDFW